jgi:hypothetical protein
MPIDLLEIARLRLRNQRVTGEKLTTPEEVVAWLGCAQSQEVALAKWSLGMRLAGAPRDADIDDALARGALLRTHILRPTWHYVAPADIRWIMRLTAPRVLAGTAGRVRNLELDDAQIAKSNDVITAALADGKQLTRLELQAELERAGLHPDGQRIAYLVMAAEMSLLIASGAPRDNKQTYALLDEFAPRTSADDQPFDRDAALEQLTLRYFTSHGPATIGDFTWWSGIGQSETKRGIEANGAALEQIDVAGERFWWAGDRGGSADPPPSPTVHLMQAYDEYVVAYKSPRTPINVAGLASPAVLQRPPFYHAIFVDTQLVGFWRRLTAKRGFTIDRVMLRDLNDSEHAALEAEAARYSAFVETPVTLV